MGQRETLYIAGIEHKAPIPMGVKIGNMVYSSAIMGKDPRTNERPGETEEEVRMVFQNIKLLMENAGGTTDHIAQMSVYLSDNDHRNLVNAEWIKMFPDENDRPTRHITIKNLAVGMKIQIQFVAVL
jgi:2-iminobutanoate/2-iminopropanoate deaminase